MYAVGLFLLVDWNAQYANPLILIHLTTNRVPLPWLKTTVWNRPCRFICSWSDPFSRTAQQRYKKSNNRHVFIFHYNNLLYIIFFHDILVFKERCPYG